MWLEEWSFTLFQSAGRRMDPHALFRLYTAGGPMMSLRSVASSVVASATLCSDKMTFIYYLNISVNMCTYITGHLCYWLKWHTSKWQCSNLLYIHVLSNLDSINIKEHSPDTNPIRNVRDERKRKLWDTSPLSSILTELAQAKDRIACSYFARVCGFYVQVNGSCTLGKRRSNSLLSSHPVYCTWDYFLLSSHIVFSTWD